MKKLLFVFCIIAFSSCGNNYEGDGDRDSMYEMTSSPSTGGQGAGEAGVITAGEWNDLDNWDFWNTLLTNGTFEYDQDQQKKTLYWQSYTNNRISVSVKSDSGPVCDTEVELQRNGMSLWMAKTDNQGKAELWVGLFQNEEVNAASLSLLVNGEQVNQPVKLYNDGINEITVSYGGDELNRAELAFIVDATGSMGDELEFLKKDLQDVILRVKDKNNSLDIVTGTVFYRDQGDDYVVKHSPFSNDINTTLDFIKKQKASGGGDFPEAVHTALSTALSELQWSDKAKSRIAFLILDAPPHEERKVRKEIQQTIVTFAQKGIKIIPVTASGIDKDTEYLMRIFSIATNGTYVFITNDSGVGNDHIEASVGDYQVEKLNDLLVRLITKYAE